MKTNYGLFILLTGCLTVPSAAAPNYDILLPSYPPNGMVIGPAGLNDLNQITGPANGMPAAPYLWQDGTLTELPMLCGFEYLYHDVNNAGRIVGSDDNSAGFLWNGTQVIRLGTLGGSGSMPFALNESDQVAGSSQTATVNETAPFLWQNNAMISLGTLGGHFGRAYAINNH
ncbi:MAG: hypothetical protein JXB18_10775, partial [Sedimentisphaerales bacterium]|nr:hypothetical protein [Sedimentisphaerales bacterium]